MGGIPGLLSNVVECLMSSRECGPFCGVLPVTTPDMLAAAAAGPSGLHREQMCSGTLRRIPIMIVTHSSSSGRSPREETNENVETFTEGLGGALAGGLGGAVFDSTGIIAEMAAGALLGESYGKSGRETRTEASDRCSVVELWLLRASRWGFQRNPGERQPATYSTGISTSAIPPPIAASKTSRSSAGDSGR